MKKFLIMIIVLVLLTVTITTTAMAAGGKVRGELGSGSVNQVQIEDPPPFQ